MIATTLGYFHRRNGKDRAIGWLPSLFRQLQLSFTLMWNFCQPLLVPGIKCELYTKISTFFKLVALSLDIFLLEISMLVSDRKFSTYLLKKIFKKHYQGYKIILNELKPFSHKQRSHLATPIMCVCQGSFQICSSFIGMVDQAFILLLTSSIV